MKRLSFCCIFAVFTIFLSAFPINAHGEGKTCKICGFEMSECVDTNTLSKLSYDKNQANGIIEHFAVSYEGMTAIGYNNYTVDIYDSDMRFRYSIKPSYSRCSYFIKWDNERLCIFVNGSKSINCYITSGYDEYTVYEIANTTANKERFYDMQNMVFSDDKYGRNYYVEDNQLIREDSQTLGEEKIGKKYFDPAILLLPIVLYFLYYMLFKKEGSINQKKEGTEK